jgi:hypothetical protein
MERKAEQSPLAAGQHARGDVEKRRRNCCSRLKDSNTANLFDDESPIAAIIRICQKDRLIQPGQKGCERQTCRLALSERAPRQARCQHTCPNDAEPEKESFTSFGKRQPAAPNEGGKHTRFLHSTHHPAVHLFDCNKRIPSLQRRRGFGFTRSNARQGSMIARTGLQIGSGPMKPGRSIRCKE